MTKTMTVKEYYGYDFTIKDIEEQARTLAEETAEIKGHQIYFVDFGGRFGYSRLVFKNHHHIHYANDYALHHSGKTKEELKELFIAGANWKLYTEAEILGSIKDYDEYKAKLYYLHNYYGMQEDYITIFFIGSDEEAEARGKQFENMIYNPVAFAYYDKSKQDFVTHHIELLRALEDAQKKSTEDFEYWKRAYIYEMNNYEYGYNWQGDYDVLGNYGNLHYKEDYSYNDYFEQLNLTETQRRAYKAARNEYLRNFDG